MTAKNQRLEARVTETQKDLFQRAAAIQGLSLSDFIIMNLQERATQVVKDHDVMVLSGKDRSVFVDALLSPPKPNKKLREAVKEHRKVLGQAVER